MKSASFNEGPRTAEFIQSAANGSLSLETKPFSGGKFLPGEVVAEVEGKYVKLDPAAEGGAKVAAAISIGAVDASKDDVPAMAVTRLAEVSEDRLVWPGDLEDIAPHVNELAGNFIQVRAVQ
ncbi:putative phage protein GP19 [Roseibium sp. TrichSKD4]|uniref:head decoration protein n=1 Tax=Roseibium sp. TrichSKD4 TaxID=744980 RepID=UPI0001E56F53|nr:head decoration protein [Roseibium sp. TrichSKD4]EFO31342.1 putative phage protein GP19 [Roseibium sp. TrichSKD4]